MLYFDRYTSILAPGLDVMNDDRLAMNGPPPARPPGAMGGAGAVAGGGAPEVEVVPEVEVLTD